MLTLDKLNDYFMYEYQDKREVRANRLPNHYMRELDMNQLKCYDGKTQVAAEK